MKRIGIYGGTFNPPHIGHIEAAAFARKALGLDELLMVPDRIAPHKTLPEGSASPEQRMDMLRLSLPPDERIVLSDLELRREGPSYTYQTIAELRNADPDAELFLLMGTDMFLSFDTWREPDAITQHAALAVLYRGEKKERQAIEAQRQRLAARGAQISVLQNPVVDISSTQLRRMLVFHCASEFLAPGVENYIRDAGLYGTGKSYRNLPMEELERVVVSLLNPNRVNHVLGCRDTAVKLAQRWGADVTDAARAGLLHDITKALSGPLQLTLCREYGTILDKFCRQNPKTLHALTGSLVAGRIFGENEAVVGAIRHHTTGRAGMTLLETIIYVADYMEPCRSFPGVEKLRELAFTDLTAALKLGLQMTLEHLNEQGSEISPESREALEYLGIPM